MAQRGRGSSCIGHPVTLFLLIPARLELLVPIGHVLLLAACLLDSPTTILGLLTMLLLENWVEFTSLGIVRMEW